MFKSFQNLLDLSKAKTLKAEWEANKTAPKFKAKRQQRAITSDPSENISPVDRIVNQNVERKNQKKAGVKPVTSWSNRAKQDDKYAHWRGGDTKPMSLPKSFLEVLMDLAKASVRTMPGSRPDATSDQKLEHFRAAFAPRNRFPGKPKAKYEPKKKIEDDGPKMTIRDLGRKLVSRGNA